MCIKSHRFLCHPYRPWECHDSKWQHQVSISWCNFSKMSEVLAGAHVVSRFAHKALHLHKGSRVGIVNHRDTFQGTDTCCETLRKLSSGKTTLGSWAQTLQQLNFLATTNHWLMVSIQLKNISENGNLPRVEWKLKNIWNHHLANHWCFFCPPETYRFPRALGKMFRMIFQKLVQKFTKFLYRF